MAFGEVYFHLAVEHNGETRGAFPARIDVGQALSLGIALEREGTGFADFHAVNGVFADGREINFGGSVRGCADDGELLRRGRCGGGEQRECKGCLFHF